MTETPASLLHRLRRSPDAAHWDRFVALYAPLIHGWTRRAGLQDADSADLIQDVFRILVQRLPQFQYDPRLRFRAWLRQVVLNAYRAWRRKRRPEPSGDLPEAEAPDPAEEFWDREYAAALSQRALRLMKADFAPATWQACWLTAVEGQRPAAVAKTLGMTVGAVYAARCRVLARLRGELDGLVS
jgi:RNA polymerase sigma-70 factor (ECF subfamily)